MRGFPVSLCLSTAMVMLPALCFIGRKQFVREAGCWRGQRFG
jgi:hypothetical protein